MALSLFFSSLLSQALPLSAHLPITQYFGGLLMHITSPSALGLAAPLLPIGRSCPNCSPQPPPPAAAYSRKTLVFVMEPHLSARLWARPHSSVAPLQTRTLPSRAARDATVNRPEMQWRKNRKRKRRKGIQNGGVISVQQLLKNCRRLGGECRPGRWLAAAERRHARPQELDRWPHWKGRLGGEKDEKRRA